MDSSGLAAADASANDSGFGVLKFLVGYDFAIKPLFVTEKAGLARP